MFDTNNGKITSEFLVASLAKCDQDCNGNGVCVRVAGEEHRCVCSPGWSGEQCETCDWIVGGGALCEEPRCINYDDGSPIECVNGECISGGKVGQILNQ